MLLTKTPKDDIKNHVLPLVYRALEAPSPQIQVIMMIRFVARTYPPCWVLKARIQKLRGKPLLFHDKCPGLHTGPTALRPIRRTKQLWLSVLLKDTSAATGQAGIRTHILATPELESNALDRSATTLREKYTPVRNTQTNGKNEDCPVHRPLVGNSI